MAGLGAGLVNRAAKAMQRPKPDEQGRTGDRGRYDADAYPGYRKGGRVKPRQAGGPVAPAGHVTLVPVDYNPFQ
jgi:hypothetical protein